MMNRFLACVAFFLICLAGAAWAAGPVSLKGGEVKIIDSPATDFTITTQGLHGRGDKLSPEAAGKPFRLLYTANNTTTALMDKVVYKLADGTEQTVVITVEPTASAPGFSGAVYDQSLRAIFLLFVLAVILESALALVFNWKPFTDNLSPRAVRPLIAFIVSLIFVNLLGIDVVATLTNALNGSHLPVSTEGKVITAMVIAGGSSGVNTLLVALGFRSVKTPETTAPKPPPEKAWLAVRAPQGKAVGDLLVFVGPPGNLALLGIIKGRSKAGSILSWFLSDRGRLPIYGGLVVPTDKSVTVEVRGVDKDGVPLPPVIYGPLQFAKGALIDIDVTL
ncbi:hypothetical protein [Reyranella sp.]|uniref:hypothetical protein n=1 Tax=Reyranella sp. TaxID=1929291 RepID=UPI002730F834|nr:hypothetical protein [Reyranella sp.]MDP2378360.1 hypothetical protein [Reyranella sp.]